MPTNDVSDAILMMRPEPRSIICRPKTRQARGPTDQEGRTPSSTLNAQLSNAQRSTLQGSGARFQDSPFGGADARRSRCAVYHRLQSVQGDPFSVAVRRG